MRRSVQKLFRGGSSKSKSTTDTSEDPEYVPSENEVQESDSNNENASGSEVEGDDVMDEGGEEEEDIHAMCLTPPRYEVTGNDPLLMRLPKLTRPETAPRYFETRYDSDDFCRYRFISKSAHFAYERGPGGHQSINIERTFPKNGLSGKCLSIYNRLNVDKWNELVVGRASRELAKEIYANAFCFNEGEGAQVNDRRIVYCRTKWLTVSPASIAEVLNWPRLQRPCQFRAYLTKDYEELKAEVEELCFPAGHTPVWTTLGNKRYRRAEVGQFRRELKWILELLSYWVAGVSPPKDFTFDLCVMALILWKGLPLDIPYRIFQSFQDRLCAHSTRSAGHAYVLLALAKLYRIHVSPDELNLSGRGAREWKKIQEADAEKTVVQPDPTTRPRRSRGKKTQGSSSQSQQAPPEVPQSQTVPPSSSQGPSIPPIPESALERGFRLMSEQAAARHAEDRQWELAQHEETRRLIAASQQENMFRFDQLREGLNHMGHQMQQQGVWIRDVGARVETQWTSGVPGEWQFPSVTFDGPQSKTGRRVKRRAGKRVVSPSTVELDDEDADE